MVKIFAQLVQKNRKITLILMLSIKNKSNRRERGNCEVRDFVSNIL